MEQIRARIREKRGVDYTEQQIRELGGGEAREVPRPARCAVRSARSVPRRRSRPTSRPSCRTIAFEDATLFESHRAPMRWIRKLLLPFLKLLFNPNPLIQALQHPVAPEHDATPSAKRGAKPRAAAMDQLYYELIHNLVVETTRLGIDNKNLKMRLESISSRLEFNERRARALESVSRLQGARSRKSGRCSERPPPQAQHRSAPQPSYPSQTPPAQARSAPAAGARAASAARAPRRRRAQAQEPDAAGQMPAEGPGQRSRRRRRRRGRRGGGPAAADHGGARDPPRSHRRSRTRPDRWTRWIGWTTTGRPNRKRRTTLRSSASSRRSHSGRERRCRHRRRRRGGNRHRAEPASRCGRRVVRCRGARASCGHGTALPPSGTAPARGHEQAPAEVTEQVRPAVTAEAPPAVTAQAPDPGESRPTSAGHAVPTRPAVKIAVVVTALRSGDQRRRRAARALHRRTSRTPRRRRGR